jgi:hypothetical protein
MTARRPGGDPCGDPPLHIPDAEETFADLIAEQTSAWEQATSGTGAS